LLGRFGLQYEGKSISIPRTAQRLVAFLALHDDHMPRSFVAGALWPDTSEDRAAADLRSTLWRLGRSKHLLVESTREYLWLSSRVTVDIREGLKVLHDMLAQSVDSSSVDLAGLNQSGDLLPGWYEDWVVRERDRFHQLRIHALEGLCDQLTASGKFWEAVEIGQTAVASDPLRESAHRALILAYLAEDNRAEAVRQFRLYRELLRSELGVEPSQHMETMVRSG
jgi:DNA-binding SARP family transcriptional activator